MEIRDPIHGSIDMSPEEAVILDTPEYQRLRAIKQLGFSELAFPAATHNRYLHSIGVCHLAGRAFDQMFQETGRFSKTEVRQRLRNCFRLASLLHDVGHGPLSHTTESVMPLLSELHVGAYELKTGVTKLAEADHVKANHEDYTVKYITDSPLTAVLKTEFPDISPLNIVSLIDKSIPPVDDFFIDQGLDYRPILSQLVSGELDCDRMDYLERDSYFCGTRYGNIDVDWLINNLIPHAVDGRVHLALNRRALYTFDDFLLARHHMNLMVYFHHKSIIYEEMLMRYLDSDDCSFKLPSQINEYTLYNDYKLFEHLASVDNPWAKRINQRKPYRVLIELHNSPDPQRPARIEQFLKEQGQIPCIWASSQTRLSKYHSSLNATEPYQMYVVDQYDRWDQPTPINQGTRIFAAYEGARVIDRIYVAPESFEQATKMISAQKI